MCVHVQAYVLCVCAWIRSALSCTCVSVFDLVVSQYQEGKWLFYIHVAKVTILE